MTDLFNCVVETGRLLLLLLLSDELLIDLVLDELEGVGRLLS